MLTHYSIRSWRKKERKKEKKKVFQALSRTQLERETSTLFVTLPHTPGGGYRILQE